MARDRKSVSRILCYLLFALLGVSAWFRSGIYPPWQWPLLTLSVLLLGGMFYLDSGRSTTLRKTLFRDPVFFIGLSFLLLLALQWANSGYRVGWDEAATLGMDRLPSKWLPWSVEPNTASQMLNWFFPAWVVLLVVRHGLERADVLLLLYLMVWNAALLALVGFVQQFAGATRMLGLWSIPGDSFYATFGYVNHAGAWFYLHAALAAGLAHHAYRRHLPGAQLLVWCACFLITLMAAFFTLGRAAAVASVVLVVAAFAQLIVWGWKRSKGNQVVNAIGLACIVGLVGAVLYFGAGGGTLAQEIEETFLGEGLQKTIEGRTMQLPSAWEIAGDYPLFGCGGWGYRWVALLHIPVDEWPQWQGVGKANIHCDPLQFLVEFGAVGVLFISACVIVLLISGIRNRNARALWNWMACGLLLVFVHSFVDLPFRCPAILLAWCTLLAALARLPARDKESILETY